MKTRRILATVMSLLMVLTLASCGHKHKYVKVDAKAATCTATGNVEYYECADCDKIFTLSGEKYTETTLDKVTTAKVAHTLEHHEAVPASYVASGSIEYWSCSVCGDKFSDAAASRKVTDAEITIAQLDVEYVDYFDVLDENDELYDYKSYVCYDLLYVLGTVLDGKADIATAELAGALDAYDVGIASIARGTSVAEIMASYKEAKQNVMDNISLANGVFNFSALSKAERTKLTGIVEKYIVATSLGGVTLYASGAYQMFNERVTLGTENYIPSYGFGVLAEGAITADLESETNAAWKRYYHTYESSNPNHMLYWDDQGQQVGDLYAYGAASLFTTFMSETKDSYVWVKELAKTDRPIAVEPDADGKSAKWKVAINTGDDGLKYTTNGSRTAYNNRLVAAEDYLTAYKVILNQHNGLFRGGEAAANTAKSIHIKGIKDYYDATKDTEALYDNALFEQYVSLSVGQEGNDWYLYWENSDKTDAFDAMTYIAGTMYSPLPMAFIEEVGLENMFGFNEDKSKSPVDNSLGLGSYVVEAWTDQEIVFKKNPNYIFADTKYSIPGVHFKVLTGIQTDPDAAMKEFLAGNLDAASLSKNYMTSEYMNDARTRRAIGGSNFKLNVNACTPEVWEKYFGEEGSITQTQQADYWVSSPLMSNIHFLRGLSYGLNRAEIAQTFGVVPSVSYLGAAYMADPENGLSYNMTPEHEYAIKLLTDDTEDGYSLQLAREYFKMAIMECEAAGTLTPGTVDNPTVITIEIAWMYSSMIEDYHPIVKQSWENAFNDESVTGGLYEIEFVGLNEGTDYTWVYFEKLMPGQFDIGFGSISGDEYNILSYMTVLSADPSLSGGFTLSFGPDTTSATDDLIIYQGKRWSFDAILSAANALTIVKDGELASAYDWEDAAQAVANADGSWTVEFDVEVNVDNPTFDMEDILAWGYPNGDKTHVNANYDEESVDFEVGAIENGVAHVTCTISSELVTKYLGAYYDGYVALDLYFSLVSGEGDAALDFTPANSYGGSVYVYVPEA